MSTLSIYSIFRLTEFRWVTVLHVISERWMFSFLFHLQNPLSSWLILHERQLWLIPYTFCVFFQGDKHLWYQSSTSTLCCRLNWGNERVNSHYRNASQFINQLINHFEKMGKTFHSCIQYTADGVVPQGKIQFERWCLKLRAVFRNDCCFWSCGNNLAQWCGRIMA